MSSFALTGIVAAPMLPMHPDFSIDWDNTRDYLAWIAAAKPTAIAMNMDASEGPSLTPLRAALGRADEALCAELGGRPASTTQEWKPALQQIGAPAEAIGRLAAALAS